MKSWSLSVILSVILFSQTSFAQLCSILKDVRIGEEHTLALDESDNLWVCGSGGDAMGLGDNASGILSLQHVLAGDMNTTSGYVENVRSFDAGWYHSLFATYDGKCFSVGNNTCGQLGNGTEDSCSVPIRVHGINNQGFLMNIVAVSAGRSGEHSIVLNDTGYPISFGYNYYGQCGDGGNTDLYHPVLVLDSNANTTGRYLGDEAFIVDIETGVHHSLALQRFSDGGIVYEWGDGVYNIPQKVHGPNGVGFLRNIVDIASCSYSLAVDSNGNVWYWNTGQNPTRIAGGQMGTTYLENIKKVAAGGDGYWAPILCAALDDNGNVWEWSGQYGLPVKIIDGEQNTSTGYLEDVIALDVGFYDQRIAIDAYGRGFGWGSNSGGALGIGNYNAPSEPTEMLCAEISPSIEFELSYEIEGLEPNCARPFIGLGIDDNYLVYSITYANPVTNPSDPNYAGTIFDVNIINELPLEVDYYSSDPCGVYEPDTRRVVWHIGALSPGEEGVLELKVKVNEYAKPCGEFTDFAHLTAEGYYTYSDVNVPVCPYGGEIIYVNDNPDSNGHNNGTSWFDAYDDLQIALAQARSGCAAETAIWIAGGTYKPVKATSVANYQNETFELVEGVALIGGFAGDETSPDQRDFSDAGSETIFDGKIGTEPSQAVNNVVTVQDVSNGLVDGVTIKNAGQYGVRIYNATIGIENCRFKSNRSYGIYADSWSYPYIHNCLFINNTSYSVYASTSEPVISYCIFDGNDATSHGLYLSNGSTSEITISDFLNHTSSAIYGGNAVVTISDCNLSQNSTAIQGSSATFNISNCDLFDNSTAVNNSYSTLNAENCNMYSNDTALSGSSASTFNLEDCRIYQNNNYGVEISGSTLNCQKTIFENNTQNGIRLTSYSNLDIENSVVRGSGVHGIYLSYGSSVEIINNWIHKNGQSSSAAGIYMESQIGTPLIRNNSICSNSSYGIERASGADPNIMNCIIVGNDTNDIYRPSGTFGKVKYCLLQRSYTGTGNITGDPCFANYSSNENDFHISQNSKCRNAGNPTGSYGSKEKDIDGETRVKNGRIDIGADEQYISEADFDSSGIVNWVDYRYLAGNWRFSQSNYSLDDDNDIDGRDLALFCEDWLWENGNNGDGWMLWTNATAGMQLMRLSSSLLSVESVSEIADTVNESSSLMLTTAAESKVKQPAKLAAKSKKFYNIKPNHTITNRQHELKSLKAERMGRLKDAQPEQSVGGVNALLNWLDNIWQNDEDVRNSMSESEYLEFRSAIEDSAN
jgi:alpha-tubulin suppressor-like RCC1 family protein